ncbi:hypothetical protein AB0D24_17215 [Streptomyces javensis]|uniref:hypothetical protein n=1 Tax=Streptomyces javensis TaxID=114698 RepID=UPI0033F1110B
MPVPREQVRFNFGAAEDLMWALGYLSGKLQDLHTKRHKLKGSDLECPDSPPVSVPWRGDKWDVFSSNSDRQQTELDRLAKEAGALKRLVQEAAEVALRARSGNR